MQHHVGQAMAHWQALAPRIGVRPGDWRPAILACRDDQRAGRIVLLLAAPDGRKLVLKHVWRSPVPGDFEQAMQAHEAAWRGFPDGVPRLLAVDMARRACVMEHAEGETLLSRLQGAPLARQLPELARAGAWLGRLHRSGQGPARGFWFRGMIGELRGMAAPVRTGRHTIREPGHFVAAAAELARRACAHGWRRTALARPHGDLHLRNMLIGQRVMGLDFRLAPAAPVSSDIARLLVYYAANCAPHGAIPKGEVLPPASLAGFLRGYGHLRPGDPVLQLMLRQRLLTEWWWLPVDPGDAADGGLYAANVMALARRAFGVPGG